MPLDEYDYVIVGGGTAGSVLAARLTEDKPRAMVLVIEAGKPESLLNDIPALVSYMQLTDYVWPYTMEKQEGVCLGKFIIDSLNSKDISSRSSFMIRSTKTFRNDLTACTA